MKKIIKIDGMSCAHCAAKAESALNSISGVSAKVNLAKKQAVVKLARDVSLSEFSSALSEYGYSIVEIK